MTTPRRPAEPKSKTPQWLQRTRERWHRTMAVLRAPRVSIEVYGDDLALAAYRSFTARHPRFRVAQTKRWGVALLQLPSAFDEYMANVTRQARRNRAKAIAAGYRHEMIAPLERIDEILEINGSTPARQGRPMATLYLERERVTAEFRNRPRVHGILDKEGRLRAYGDVIDIGGAYTFRYLIGHATDLRAGIMYLLMAEIVRDCIAGRRSDGSPQWLMADTFWGASPGLAFFKDRAGFRPFTVRWIWVDRSPAASLAPGHEPER